MEWQREILSHPLRHQWATLHSLWAGYSRQYYTHKPIGKIFELSNCTDSLRSSPFQHKETSNVSNICLNLEDTVQSMSGKLRMIVPQINELVQRLEDELINPVYEMDKRDIETQTSRIEVRWRTANISPTRQWDELMTIHWSFLISIVFFRIYIPHPPPVPSRITPASFLPDRRTRHANDQPENPGSHFS